MLSYGHGNIFCGNTCRHDRHPLQSATAATELPVPAGSSHHTTLRAQKIGSILSSVQEPGPPPGLLCYFQGLVFEYNFPIVPVAQWTE